MSLIDPTTGEMLGDDSNDGCSSCAAQERRAQGLIEDLTNAERELRALRRRLAAMETQAKKGLEDSPEMKDAKAIYHYWVKRTNRNPKRTKFTDDRKKVVLARLRESREMCEFQSAIDGIMTSEWHIRNHETDLELICRNGKNFEKWRDVGERGTQ